MTNALPYHYEPLEARRNELMMEDSGTQGIIVLEDDQMIIYPMNSRETMTILRRSLLSLLHHVVRFRLENPAIANVSLLIELKALSLATAAPPATCAGDAPPSSATCTCAECTTCASPSGCVARQALA